MEPVGGNHLLEYGEVLRRRRWVVYVAVSVVTLVALVGSFLATPLYRATTTLQIERQNPDILSMRDLAKMDFSFAAYMDYYQTQYRILMSDAVAKKAVRDHHLASHPDFALPDPQPTWRSRLRSLLPGSAAGGGDEADPLFYAAKRLQQRLEVAPLKNSHLVQVSWVSPDPALAAQVANAVGKAYIEFNLELQFTTSSDASDFLADQVGKLREEIGAIEERLQQYGESKNIVSIDDSSNITLQALSDVAARRTEAQTALARAEAAYRAVRAAPPDAIPEVLHSSLIGRLKEDYATYEARYSEQGRVFKDDWPEMRSLASKMEQARERLDIESRKLAQQVILAAQSEYDRARKEVENLDALLDRRQRDAQHLKRDAVGFADLQGEVKKKRETLNGLIARQGEMALATRLREAQGTSSNVRVVDEARPPSASFRPNRRMNVLVGVLLGLVAGIAGAFLLDALDNSIRSTEEVQRLVGLPTLAVVPRHGAGPTVLERARRGDGKVTGEVIDLVAHGNARAAASEAFRELRTALLLSNPGRPPRQILVTSAVPGEGKSATATNLAVVLAQLGLRVALVDADLRRPRLHEVFDLANGEGLSTFLSGLVRDPLRLPVPTRVESLHVIPSGPIPPNPSELLNSPLLVELAQALLAGGFDHVVYDSPPVLAVADPVVVASRAESVVLVARAGRTPRQSLRLAVDKLVQAGVKPVGVVLNDVDARGGGYVYYQHYGRAPHRDGADAPAPRRKTGTG